MRANPHELPTPPFRGIVPDMNAAATESTDRIVDHLGLMVELGAEFAATGDVEATLAKAVELITRSLDAAGGALFMLDVRAGRLRCEACWGATAIEGLEIAADAGIVGRCVQQNRGEIVRDVAKDPDFFGGVDAKTGFTTRSILCAPMSVKDERIGAIELVNKRGGDGLFTEADLSVLSGLAASAAMAVINARQAEALVEQERVRRELELAAEIQRSLLPSPRPEPFAVHGTNTPARAVSGDFYDFFELPDGRICFNLGDVSGKGINAALLMAKTASIYRCLGRTIPEPGRLLARVNAEICETATRGMFVTMVGGIYDPAAGTVRIANAGHEPPLLRRPDGSYTAFAADSPPLGIVPPFDPDETLPETEIALAGGTLYVFTDGITEGYTATGAMLGVDGLKALLDANAHMPTADRIDAVAGSLRHGGRPLRDDLTLLAVSDGSAASEAEGLLRLVFAARPDELKRVRGAMAAALSAAGFDAGFVGDVVLVVDEACQNVIRHAYGGDPTGEAVLEMRREDGDLIITLRDFAPSVDPAKVKPRDLDDIRPGGLGTHFMQEIMDSVEFLPPSGHGGNVLRMVKRIERG